MSPAALVTLSPLVALAGLFASMSHLGCGAPAPKPSPPTPIAVLPSESATTSAAPAVAASASTPPPPSRVSNALPPIGSTVRFGRSIECASAPQCAHPGLLPPGERPEASLPAFFWEERFAKGKALAFPRVEEVELYGVVLDGEVTVRGDEEPVKGARKLSAWMAFRAPGAGVTLGGAGRLVLVAATRDGAPLLRLLNELASASGPGAKTHAWKARPRAIETVDFGAVPSLDWGDGAYHARLGFEASASKGEGAPLGLGVLIASKDAPVKEHVHDKEWELLAVLDGEGELVERPASGERRTKVDGATFLAIPPNEPHAWAPTGTRPLIALQAYSPPGPEQRFKRLAGVAASASVAPPPR
jgi:mannose-6-phosphate isomerase-like protein (cupin superfamily)